MEWTEPPLPNSASSAAFRPSGPVADQILRTESDETVGTLWPTDDFVAMLTMLTESHRNGAEGWERTADLLRGQYAQVNEALPSPLTPGDQVVRMMDAAAAAQRRADVLAEAVTAMWRARREIHAIIDAAHAALDNGADEDATVDTARRACVEANRRGCEVVRSAFAEVMP